MNTAVAFETSPVAEIDEVWLDARLRQVTRVRGIYQAAWRALEIARRYRAECCVRREPWREDKRILGCLEIVAAYRASIRSLRAAASS